jgi:hypothetical protein
LEELTYHLIFQCPFAERRCWDLLNIHWDHHLPFFDTIQKTKSEWHLGYFMETFAIAAWEFGRSETVKSSEESLLSMLGKSTLPLL